MPSLGGWGAQRPQGCAVALGLVQVLELVATCATDTAAALGAEKPPERPGRMARAALGTPTSNVSARPENHKGRP